LSLKSALRNLIADLADLQEEDPGLHYALIGGLAVGAWGHPRATKDIDLLAVTPAGPAALKTALEKAGYAVDIMRNPDDPLPLLLRIAIPRKKGGLAEADMLIATRRSERLIVEEARLISFEGLSLPICRPEDLVAMKLAAGGPYDLLDAREVFKVNRSAMDEDYLLRRAKDLKVLKELEDLLADADTW
jgi:hypothetical protein